MKLAADHWLVVTDIRSIYCEAGTVSTIVNADVTHSEWDMNLLFVMPKEDISTLDIESYSTKMCLNLEPGPPFRGLCAIFGWFSTRNAL